eukprot:2703372-Rhodomonas_salina.1
MPSGNAAKLELLPTMHQLDSTFSFDCLRPYHASDADLPPRAPPPPPPAFVDTNGNPSYFVERIVAEKPCTYKGQKTVKYPGLYGTLATDLQTTVGASTLGSPKSQQAKSLLTHGVLVPGPVTRDRAGRHCNKTSAAP